MDFSLLSLYIFSSSWYQVFGIFHLFFWVEDKIQDEPSLLLVNLHGCVEAQQPSPMGYVEWIWHLALVLNQTHSMTHTKSKKWYFVTTIVLTYSEKKLFYWSKKPFEIWGWGPRIFKILKITWTIYSNSERSEQFLVTECFFNLFLEVSHM